MCILINKQFQPSRKKASNLGRMSSNEGNKLGDKEKIEGKKIVMAVKDNWERD